MAAAETRGLLPLGLGIRVLIKHTPRTLVNIICAEIIADYGADKKLVLLIENRPMPIKPYKLLASYFAKIQ